MHSGFKGTCEASGDMLATCSTSAEPLKGASGVEHINHRPFRWWLVALKAI